MTTSNRRRILAGSCTALLAAQLLVVTISGLMSRGTTPSQAGIAMNGFLAVLWVGLTAGAVFGITQLVRRKADRLGLAGGALMILGATVGARIIALHQVGMLATITPGASLDALTAPMKNAPLVFVSLVPIGLMYPIGVILLGIALFIARPVNRTAAILMIVGGVLFPIGRAIGIEPAVYASDAILAITYGYLSHEILTRRELWDDSLASTSPAQRRDSEYDGTGSSSTAVSDRDDHLPQQTLPLAN
ncbi:MAG TPA: hypothetical protein VF911_00355 [Thermoanaerobaculia bacterium]